VAQEEVKNPGQITAKIDEAKKSGRKSVLMLVDRQGDLRFVALKIDQG
jgi:serine protease Do